MTTIPETLRQASEALQQASAALTTVAQAMEDAPGPEPAPEPEPGEWRNDRAPTEYETDDKARVWVWQPGASELVSLDLASFWYESCPARNYWAPGNRPAPKSPPLVLMTDGHGAKLGPAPKSPPPSVVASQEVEPQPDASPEPGKSHTGGWIVDRVPTRKDADACGQVRIPGAHQDELSLTTWTNFYFVHPGTPWCSSDDYLAPWDPTCLDRNGWIRSRLPTVEDANGVGVVLIPVGRGGTTSTINYHLIVPGQPWAPWGSNPGGFEK